MTEHMPFRTSGADSAGFFELETILDDYRNLVTARYVQAGESVARYIDDGRLPTTYRLPELSTFEDRIAALAPIYEAYAVNDWMPEVVVVPERLSLEQQWHKLLSGHKLEDGHMSEGVWLNWSNYAGRPVGPIAQATDAGGRDLWDLAVVSASEKPVLVNISPDGIHGSGAAIALASLRGLPGVTDTSPGIVKRISPSHDSYLALQLARLERGEPPVDPDHTETWTIARENIKVDGVKQSLYLYWRSPIHRVASDYTSMGYYRGALGVRPTVCGRDLVLSSP